MATPYKKSNNGAINKLWVNQEFILSPHGVGLKNKKAIIQNAILI